MITPPVSTDPATAGRSAYGIGRHGHDRPTLSRPSSGEAGTTTDLSFLAGLKIQMRVIAALILRELNSRYGRENIGVLWVIGEPMMLAGVITLIHLAEPNHYGSDITPAPFAIIGYSIFIVFRGIVNKSEALVDQNREIFFHRKVSIFDIIFARSVIETLSCAFVTFLLLGLAVLSGLAFPPARPLYLLSAMALMFWWSFSISMIVARATYKNEMIGRQVHVMTYFCIPISGAFFQLSSVPVWISAVLQWFPMTLIMEQARYGQFRSASAHFVDPGYVAAICALLTYLGLLLIRRLRYNL